MDIKTVSFAGYSVKDMTDTFNAAFEGYIIGSPNFTEEIFADFFSSSMADLSLSRFILLNNEIKGMALVSRFNNESRLATMGISASATKKGLGIRLLKDIINDAKKRGDKKFVLEVIEQNTPAVKLYEKFGFKKIRRLHGFEINNPELESNDIEIEESDFSSILAYLLLNRSLNLPWQISMPNLMRLNFPDRVFKTDNAFAAISNPVEDVISIKTLIPKDGDMKFTEELLRGLLKLYPGKTWKANVHYPEEFMPLFRLLGFQEHKLTQLQMEYII